MATPDVASGTAAGLMAFQDFMINKGYASAGAIKPRKTAAKQVFSTVEGDDFGDLDVRTLDPEEYLTRFENRSMGKYSADSLAAYRSRFRKAVEAYQNYLKDPNWKPATTRVSAPSPSSGGGKRGSGVSGRSAPARSHGSRRSQPKADGPIAGPSASAPAPSLMAYPFPLKSGQVAQLHLPTQLEADDAERLTHFIRALVFEQPRQLRPGRPGEE